MTKLSDRGTGSVSQHPSADFSHFTNLLHNQIPFTFVRFSDGEMEILRNNKLVIGPGLITWSKGEVEYSYPDFDHKEFIPERDLQIRSDLLSSAVYIGERYFKGVPGAHNSAIDDRDLMIKLNGGNTFNLTFADLLINENYLKFRKAMVQQFLKFRDVFFLGNLRSLPELLSSKWKLIPIQDNFFSNYEEVLSKVIHRIEAIPKDSLILSSASSLSNIVGFKAHEMRSDLTFIDVGTSMHDLVGMHSGIREYHILLANSSWKNNYRKLRYVLGPSFKMKW
jgi:hypothetical protein